MAWGCQEIPVYTPKVGTTEWAVYSALRVSLLHVLKYASFLPSEMSTWRASLFHTIALARG